ncbi:MAG: zinc-ribbon domain-containing protein [Deltaproteobacteria bacterium]|nr:zinc-ribbon domain-containing protein [Deltaproteobacteria bacterium]
MIFTCDNCNAQYKISDDRIPAKGAKVKCKKCGNIITIRPQEVSFSEANSYQDEATVVQRSPFASEGEDRIEATRVVSQEQAAGIFKSLINEHSRSMSQESEHESDTYQSEKVYSGYSAETTDSQYYSVGQESADDRPTSVYESTHQSEEEIQDETEQKINEMLRDDKEEDISREATRVVSTEQLKQIVGEDEIDSVGKRKEQSSQSYFSHQQPYVAPKSRGEWYVAIGQMQVGPLSMNELEEKWGRGEINSTTLVWKAGMSGWQPLMYVQELTHLVPPTHYNVVEQMPPVQEYKTQAKQEEETYSSSSTFPSLDDLARQEEELKTRREEESPIDWKPSAGEALASLVQDEMESIQRGFSTDIPIVTKPEESVSTNLPSEASMLPFDKPQEPVAQPYVPTKQVPPTPIVTEPPVTISAPPYQTAYPPVYPTIYSQPPQKVEKSRFIPILATVAGLILVVGVVFGYILYSKLLGEKVTPPTQTVQQQVQQQPQQPPQPQVQQPPQTAQPQESIKRDEVVKEEEQKKGEQTKVEEPPKRESQEPKKESPRPTKVAVKDEKVERQPPKKVVKKEEEEEMPPSPPREEKKAKKEEVAAKEEEPPAKKKQPSKVGDSLLDFEGDQGAKPTSGGLPKTLTQEQILEVVKANIGRIKVCMAEQAQRDPSVKGKLVIGWEIQPNGKTKNVQIKTPQFKGTYIGTCISSVVTDFNFPKFSGPPIPIEFPFNIK